MNGKFRKRSEAVWCPKPKTKLEIPFPSEVFSQYAKALRENDEKTLKDIVLKYTVKKKVTGWTNWGNCGLCEHLEEYHLDNAGVFCLFGIDPSLATKEDTP